MEVRLSGIINESIVDGPGLRYVVFFQGCAKRCFMCHNPSTHAMDGGYLNKCDEIIKGWRKNPLLKGVTFSGGEPFLQPEQLYYLVSRAKADGLDVIVYSGYYYEDLLKFRNPYVKLTLQTATLLIDGPFDHKLKSLNIAFRGSSNQRIVDLVKTNELNELTFYHVDWETKLKEGVENEITEINN